MNIKKDELMENYEMGDEIFQEYISEQISEMNILLDNNSNLNITQSPN